MTVARPVAERHVMRVWLDSDHEAAALETLHRYRPRLVDAEPRVRFSNVLRHRAAVGDDHRHGKIVALGHLEVRVIVSRGDLYRAGAELAIHEFIRDDR